MAAIWGIALPWIASRPTIARRLSDLEAQGIDPSAMYYTELPAMEHVLFRLDRFHHSHPDALWNPRDESVGR